ncbi:hypothetical protein METUNv1_03183 [Methyloversatilis universalis FAM5]|uniref:Uncharacterized protein n=1 Tax=Methyloversatilis universalis (strain ATCC BAA-1314 / DSM 25237 / JCM 13912 / CCUG 52030 / FAM5) TaxID=1000565 RepID=F5RFU6_METUF|nr:hypothetical protein METUNv1_03183 [Methyloversatilis universalis FAM5]
MGVMSIAARKHNQRASNPRWWKRYFWSQHEFWAKHAVNRAAHRAKVSRMDGDGQYFFWCQVVQRAASFCSVQYGPVPELLLHRPIARSVFALSSREVSSWLRVQSPYRNRGVRSCLK